MDKNELEKLISTAPAPHIPELLPLDFFKLITPEIMQLISEANNAIGKYSGFLSSIPNPSILLAPITTQEAVLSSKLEGTHATIEDIFNHEAGNATEIQDDEIKEILNYRKALVYAVNNITPADKLHEESSKSPLTVKIIKSMHKILLDNVRGSTKHPGHFKVNQNYIGGTGHISFTPLPPLLTEQYMSNLEVYIHKDELDTLTQAAIIHAQFEMIHPFEDGNGRIGRLMIPLFLYYRSRIPLPIFYLSSYFNANKDIYIAKLANISKSKSWQEWITYFLTGVTQQADINVKKANAILLLYENYKANAKEIKSYRFIDFLDFIFEHPIFTTNSAIEELQVSRQTCSSIFNKMEKLGMISSRVVGNKKTYIFDKLLFIVDK